MERNSVVYVHEVHPQSVAPFGWTKDLFVKICSKKPFNKASACNNKLLRMYACVGDILLLYRLDQQSMTRVLLLQSTPFVCVSNRLNCSAAVICNARVCTGKLVRIRPRTHTHTNMRTNLFQKFFFLKNRPNYSERWHFRCSCQRRGRRKTFGWSNDFDGLRPCWLIVMKSIEINQLTFPEYHDIRPRPTFRSRPDSWRAWCECECCRPDSGRNFPVHNCWAGGRSSEPTALDRWPLTFWGKRDFIKTVN